CVRHWDYFDYW
nr:immunoglobulin heavy chain junction region [Mus musculus]